MRHWNFAAGPATIPLAVLEQVREELPDWHGAGCGVMEMSHRGKIYTSIYEQVVADLRKLMDIPEDYAILFLQGGATLQFSQIPMNILDGGSADYLTTGAWSEKAVKAGQRLYGDAIREAGTSADSARNGRVVAAKLVSDEDEIMLITTGGVLIRTRVKEIRELGRATQGVTLISLDDGEKLAGLEKIVETDDEEEN